MEKLKWIDDIFTVVFTMEAINLIKLFSEKMEQHGVFRDFIEPFIMIEIPELERIFEQKLAMFISLKVKERKNVGEIIICDSDVTKSVTLLIHDIINMGNEILPEEGTIAHMLDGYPILLLSKVCDTNTFNAHIMGESMKKFIQIRKTHKDWLPIGLEITIFENCELVGEEKSPLERYELDALFRYLNTNRSIYITMLLNCIFELREHERVLKCDNMKADDIIKVCNSSWLTLFLCTL